jgi:hypothetical protein
VFPLDEESRETQNSAMSPIAALFRVFFCILAAKLQVAMTVSAMNQQNQLRLDVSSAGVCIEST